MLAIATLLGIALLIVALVAALEARAARRPYERALDRLVAEERDARFIARVTHRVDRANRNRGED